MKRLRSCLVALLLTALGVGSAFAQAFPSRSVTLVVPFAAGSVTDVMARIVAEEAARHWKQPVVVHNRPGATGPVSVANAPPDGYTLMMTANAHTVLGVTESVAFDPIKDFAGITRVADVPFCLFVNAQLPARNVKELVELAKRRPGTLNYASAGIGGAGYIATLLFKEMAGLDIVHVPYKGGPEAARAVGSGEAHLTFLPPAVAKPLADTGRLRNLATATSARLRQWPDTPTLTEAGVPLVYNAWYGLLAPAGVPKPLLEQISRDIREVLKSPQVQARFEAQGFLPAGDTAEQFQRVLQEEAARYGPLMKRQPRQ